MIKNRFSYESIYGRTPNRVPSLPVCLYEYGGSRQSKREETSKKFTRINLALELKCPTNVFIYMIVMIVLGDDDNNSDGYYKKSNIFSLFNSIVLYAIYLHGVSFIL